MPRPLASLVRRRKAAGIPEAFQSTGPLDQASGHADYGVAWTSSRHVLVGVLCGSIVNTRPGGAAQFDIGRGGVIQTAHPLLDDGNAPKETENKQSVLDDGVIGLLFTRDGVAVVHGRPVANSTSGWEEKSLDALVEDGAAERPEDTINES
jgi:hypothetical protein